MRLTYGETTVCAASLHCHKSDGTADLLATCLPDPQPNLIPPLDPPGASVGVQFRQTPWSLPGQSEDEICMATYYKPSDAKYSGITDFLIERPPRLSLALLPATTSWPSVPRKATGNRWETPRKVLRTSP